MNEAREWQHAALPLASEDAVARRLHSRMIEKDGRITWREAPGLRSYQRANQVSADKRWDTLKKVRCRTLFLLGANSGLVSDETAEKASVMVTRGQWRRIPGAGHTCSKTTLPIPSPQ
jgi:pimeloyl-ACP methyl ester carboxylesterase